MDHSINRMAVQCTKSVTSKALFNINLNFGANKSDKIAIKCRTTIYS